MDKQITLMAKSFFSVIEDLSLNDGSAKTVHFQGEEFKDEMGYVYIPLDSNFKVCKDYNGTFRDQDSKYLCKMQKSKS